MNYRHTNLKVSILNLMVINLIIGLFPVYGQIKPDSLPGGLPLTTSWYVQELPIPGDLKNLCSTPEGRWQIINSMDTIQKYDLSFQWQGELLNGDSTHKTFDSFLLAYINRRCEGGPGYVFNIIPNYSYFQYLGGPNQPTSMYCISENTGGSHKYDCNETTLIRLPTGWQVCKVWTKVKTVRHGKFSISPTLWYNEDNNQYPRFRGYELKATGHGDVGNPSSVYLTELKILAIKEEFKNDMRKQCGCDMPSKPSPVVSQPPPQPTKPVSLPAKMNGILTNKRGNMADLIFSNTGGSRGRMIYRVDALDGDDGQWKKHAEGYVDLDPNSVYTLGLHKWRVRDWRIVYMQQTSIQ